MRATLVFAPWLLMLSSCSLPPAPPTVDEATRRPANAAGLVELQACRHELHNHRLVSAEQGRQAPNAQAAAARLAAQQQAVPVQAQVPEELQANGVFVLHFGFNSSRVNVPPDVAQTLAEAARAAPLVLLRGRTDGTSDAPAESRIARERAAAVRDYLVAAGVSPQRIRATYQPAGDHLADNTTANGRSLNRRVEIELYRTAPVALSAAVLGQP